MDNLESKFVGSLVGAIAGAYYGVEKIPKEWKDILENKNYIEGLAQRLWHVKTERPTEK
jgi:ADP-ribosylglycohydrolase